MLAKTTEKERQDWDRCFPYVLFAYRATEQQSNLESLFFLLMNMTQDYQQKQHCIQKLIDLREYSSELAK